MAPLVERKCRASQLMSSATRPLTVASSMGKKISSSTVAK